MSGTGNHERAPRGEVVGWSPAAARRQVRWLWSVNVDSMDGYGYAVTLTLRDLPADAATWNQLRRAWLKRVQRLGATRVHWVVEWQARGVPHLHAAVYFAAPLATPGLLGWHWIAVSAEHGSSVNGQDVNDITGTMGWLKYLAKHAARGSAHYQRQGHPEGWTKTGRMWGYTGSWDVAEPDDYPELTNPEFYRLRRILRRWSLAQASAARDWKRVVQLRRGPGRIDPSKSRYVGISEWVGEAEMLRLVDYLARGG